MYIYIYLYIYMRICKYIYIIDGLVGQWFFWPCNDASPAGSSRITSDLFRVCAPDGKVSHKNKT